MIVYDLSCDKGHRFEGWFRSSEDFKAQLDGAGVACPHCGTHEVRKGFSAPNLANGATNRDPSDGKDDMAAMLSADLESQTGPSQAINKADLPPALRTQLQEAFAKVRKHVESTFDYVGDRFAEEARRIHYGETDDRNIYGEATYLETEELIEEGIDVMPLPATSRKTDA